MALIVLIAFFAWMILRNKGIKPLKQILGNDIWIDRSIYPYPAYINQAKAILSQSTGTFSNKLISSGYSIVAIWAVICHETGWLSDDEAKQAIIKLNNILGIEADGALKKFESIDACLNFFKYMIEDKPDTKNLYRNAYAVRNYGDQFLIQLHYAGYNPNLTWLRSVLDIYHNWFNPNFID